MNDKTLKQQQRAFNKKVKKFIKEIEKDIFEHSTEEEVKEIKRISEMLYERCRKILCDKEMERCKRANEFARNLLMPRKQFIEEWYKPPLIGDPLEKMSKTFDVDVMAIKQRALELGLIGEA